MRMFSQLDGENFNAHVDDLAEPEVLEHAFGFDLSADDPALHLGINDTQAQAPQQGRTGNAQMCKRSALAQQLHLLQEEQAATETSRQAMTPQAALSRPGSASERAHDSPAASRSLSPGFDIRKILTQGDMCMLAELFEEECGSRAHKVQQAVSQQDQEEYALHVQQLAAAILQQMGCPPQEEHTSISEAQLAELRASYMHWLAAQRAAAATQDDINVLDQDQELLLRSYHSIGTDSMLIPEDSRSYKRNAQPGQNLASLAHPQDTSRATTGAAAAPHSVPQVTADGLPPMLFHSSHAARHERKQSRLYHPYAHVNMRHSKAISASSVSHPLLPSAAKRKGEYTGGQSADPTQPAAAEVPVAIYTPDAIKETPFSQHCNLRHSSSRDSESTSDGHDDDRINLADAASAAAYDNTTQMHVNQESVARGLAYSAPAAATDAAQTYAGQDQLAAQHAAAEQDVLEAQHAAAEQVSLAAQSVSSGQNVSAAAVQGALAAQHGAAEQDTVAAEQHAMRQGAPTCQSNKRGRKRGSGAAEEQVKKRSKTSLKTIARGLKMTESASTQSQEGMQAVAKDESHTGPFTTSRRGTLRKCRQATETKLASAAQQQQQQQPSTPDGYRQGQLVWAQIQGHPFWPAVVDIASRREQKDSKLQEDQVFVRFCGGAGEYAAMDVEDVCSWNAQTQHVVIQQCSVNSRLKASVAAAHQALHNHYVFV